MIERMRTGGVPDETSNDCRFCWSKMPTADQIKGGLGYRSRSGYRGGRVPRDDDLLIPTLRDDFDPARCRTHLGFTSDGLDQCVVALTVFDLLIGALILAAWLCVAFYKNPTGRAGLTLHCEAPLFGDLI